ncbi:hypothetical protein DL89DRAFT_265540 [Linderina pennispora]|uniref:Uncharacterized protein n=1 Tax=Linderina pennispora TaxID=61395 RepID=A0A1Y1WE78_9FUNG|nr:uncharacterized protein DL89DRAFT_265540 [Linderina pennispora]ORX71829.1 hypothetical protein DL89DRAFT_265540 [Linderina pennispora]
MYSTAQTLPTLILEPIFLKLACIGGMWPLEPSSDMLLSADITEAPSLDLVIATSVRFVMLSFDLRDILDGTAIDELLVGHVFPSVAVIHLHLRSTPADIGAKLLEETANAIRFCNAVDNIFPGAKRVIIQCANLVNWFIDELFSGLMRGKTCIRIGDGQVTSYSVDPGSILCHSTGPLRTLVAFGIGEGSPVGEIIRRNSGTLEVLHFGTMDPNVVRTILFNNDGTPVVYDRLTTLYIVDHCEQITYANNFLMPSDGSTFPMLESLVFTSQSPGLYEFLARGTGRLLTKIDFFSNHSTIERLIRYGFFNPERYPAIKSILFAYDGSRDTSEPSLNPTSLALRLCRNACNAMVIGDTITWLDDHLLDLDNLNPHVQTLRLPFMTRPFLRRLGIAVDLPDEQMSQCSEHAGCSATCAVPRTDGIGHGSDDTPTNDIRALYPHSTLPYSARIARLDLYVQHFCMTLVHLFLLCPNLRSY